MAVVMIAAVFTFACGSDKTDDKDYSTGERYTWEADIAAIVATDCSNSGCHGTIGPLSTVYQNNEANFRAAKTDVIARLTLDAENSSFMPKGMASFPAEKKEKLIGFLNQ